MEDTNDTKEQQLIVPSDESLSDPDMSEKGKKRVTKACISELVQRQETVMQAIEFSFGKFRNIDDKTSIILTEDDIQQHHSIQLFVPLVKRHSSDKWLLGRWCRRISNHQVFNFFTYTVPNNRPRLAVILCASLFFESGCQRTTKFRYFVHIITKHSSQLIVNNDSLYMNEGSESLHKLTIVLFQQLNR